MLNIDTMKLRFTKDGESVYFNSNEEFIHFLRDKLGDDIADVITEPLNNLRKLSEEAIILYDTVVGLQEDWDKISPMNPVLRLKKLHEIMETLRECEDFLLQISVEE